MPKSRAKEQMKIKVKDYTGSTKSAYVEIKGLSFMNRLRFLFTGRIENVKVKLKADEMTFKSPKGKK